MIAVIVFTIALTCVRYSIYKMSISLDEKLCTQSDFGIMISNMEFSDISKAGMEKEVKEYLGKEPFNVPEDQIIYFNPAFDIFTYHVAMTHKAVW